MSRLENHTKHCEVCAAGYAEHCYEREAAQEFDELTAEREALRKRVEGIPADDWQGMYHVAAKRAQEWEDKAKALQAELDAAREAVKWWFVPEHDAICRSMPSKSCCCNADAAAVRRRDARIALKLEVGKLSAETAGATTAA